MRCSGGAARLRTLLASPRPAYLAGGMGRRTLAGVVETLAKAAVNQALDRAILKDRLGSFGSSADTRASSSSPDGAAALVDDGTADVETWRAIVDQPLVRSADSIELKDLLLVSNDMLVLCLAAHQLRRSPVVLSDWRGASAEETSIRFRGAPSPCTSFPETSFVCAVHRAATLAASSVCAARLDRA